MYDKEIQVGTGKSGRILACRAARSPLSYGNSESTMQLLYLLQTIAMEPCKYREPACIASHELCHITLQVILTPHSAHPGPLVQWLSHQLFSICHRNAAAHSMHAQALSHMQPGLHRDHDVVLVGLLPLESALLRQMGGRSGAVGPEDALHVELVPVVCGGAHHTVPSTVPA